VIGAADTLVIAAGLPGIGRRAAQELARRELSKSIYQPSVSQRVLEWIARQLDRLFSVINTNVPGGWWALVSLVILAALIVSVVLVQVRPGAPRRAGRGQPLAGQAMSASDHCKLADSHAGAGDYSAAIIERVRAVAAELQERSVLPARPGRTADEFAAEASLSMPALAGQLTDAARLFDDVRYGGRTGTSAGYERVRDLDNAVRSARLAVAAGAGSTGAGSTGAGSTGAVS
jgi:hypothetical protein